MPDNKVEKFRVTPEMKEFVSTYEKRNKLSKGLKIGIADTTSRLQAMTNALYQIEQQKDAMLKSYRPVPNLPNQEGPEVDLRIMY